MTWLGRLFRKGKQDAQLDSELRFHVEQQIADNIAAGMSPAEARRKALAQLGGLESRKEECREARSLHFLETFAQDIRFALRMLRKSPGFTAVAILTLALGIGANTAIFSVVDAVLLRPLPYPNADRLMMVYQAAPQIGVQKAGLSYPNFQDWSHAARSFEDLAAMRTSEFALSGNGEAINVTAGAVTSGYFPMFRVPPIIGRTFSRSEDVPGAPAVAVLSERLWRSRFGSDPTILGKTIQLDQRPFTVIGVVPGTFRAQIPDSRAVLWVPLLQDSIAGQLYQRRAGHYLRAAGRLKAGVTLPQARSELQSIQEALQKQFPEANKGWDARIIPLQKDLTGNFRLALFVLLGAVGLVFLIACANVASLQMVRATSRQREVAIRIALGAGRARLFQQFLTECIVVGMTGGAAGLLAAYATVQGFVSWLPADLPRISEIRVNADVLGFCLALAVLSGVILGLAPAWRPGGERFADALKEGARSGEDVRRRTLRNVLVVSEMTLAVVLLVGSGLLIRSFERLANVNPGFNPSHLLVGGVSLSPSQYAAPQKQIDFYNQVLGRMKTIPGAQESAIVMPLPLVGGYINLGFQIEGRPPLAQSERPTANFVMISPNYFHAMQIPLLRGREFADSDMATAPKVCLISEAVARSAFGSENPIGKRVAIGYPESATREIIGVVGDVKDMDLASSGVGQVYVPFVQNPVGGIGLVVRSRGDVTQLSSAVRSEFQAIDPSLPVEGVETMTSAIGDSVTEPRFRTTLLGLFGALALLLATIGIYGVISYNTGLRTREIGIRMALGAQRRDVLRLIVTQVFLLAATGVAIGLAASFGFTRYLKMLLFHTGTMDAVTYAAVAGLMIAVALAACYFPARRAMRVDPMVALRYE